MTEVQHDAPSCSLRTICPAECFRPFIRVPPGPARLLASARMARVLPAALFQHVGDIEEQHRRRGRPND